MKRYIKIILILFLLSINVISFAYSKYTSTVNKKVTLNIGSSNYMVVFHSNNGLDEETTQEFAIGVSERLDYNTFTNNDLGFAGWNTEIDGSGTRYSDGELVTDLTSTPNAVVHLYAQWADGVALYNGVSYGTLDLAMNQIINSQTVNSGTVILLKDTTAYITIPTGKTITLDIGNNIISNKTNNNPIFEVNGVLNISNGTLIHAGTRAGAINVRSGGVLNISGGDVSNTGERQAIYCDQGTVYISGDTYLHNNTGRAALQNQSNSTVYITGGTFTSDNNSAIENSGTMVVGTHDGNPDSSIVARGYIYGINNGASFDYYDGVFYGKTRSINNETKIGLKDDDCLLRGGTEEIGGVDYKKSYLVKGATVTFNPNGGTVTNTEIVVAIGDTVGTLQTPTRVDYRFLGWYTDPIDGIKIESNTVINSNITFYAHWSANNTNVARIGDVYYDSLQDAINDCEDGTSTTIVILKGVKTYMIINSGKEITLDLNNQTLQASSGKALIENNGNLTVTNGSMTSSLDTAVINHNENNLIIDNVSIIATGTRQSIFVQGGNVTITGNSYLSSATSGQSAVGVLERGTVHTLANGTITILSGTIVNTNGNAITDEGGIITLGSKDGTIDNTSIIIQGKRYGVETNGTFNYYDGVIKGLTDVISGTITNQEDNTHIIDGTEVIGTDTYSTKHLELD